jgi:hypothetical protein
VRLVVTAAEGYGRKGSFERAGLSIDAAVEAGIFERR